jgi:hypothetical protein
VPQGPLAMGVRSKLLVSTFVVALAFVSLSASGGVDPLRAAEAPPGVACEGDECQGPAPAPDDPTPGTAIVEGPPNPPVRFPKANHGKSKKQKQARKKQRQQRRDGSRRATR